MNYDLKALDDKEFEALITDLLGILFNCRIERFKTGKDAGVDGRWFLAPGQEALIQCKHWMRTGYDRLLRHLAAVEKSKLIKLNPTRYILVSSVELSRKNKHQIATVLSPFVRADDDVFGREDIDDLLSRNPDVERRHYKLWLSSTAVLNHILNNAILGRSGFNADEIREKAPIFVKTADFDRAEHLLNNRHAAIITGVPGIGKTTLAEQLVVKLLADSYELVSMTDITDGESVFAPKKKQVFYFDDFLGRNLLEALKLQHDSQIVHFIRRVTADKDKRFILTSRSSILNQGKHLSDLFALYKTEGNEYEVRISNLSKLEKAKMLYSHIWHSNLPEETLDQLFVNKRYKTIAEHRNFNPRLISFITDSDLAGMIEVDKYWDYVVATLDNPQNLWDHYFGQLSQDCRDLVYLVVFNGKVIAEHDLMSAFRRLRRSEGHDSGEIEETARVALKVCTGSVLNRNINLSTGKVQYDLYNPSIGDYVIGRIGDITAYTSFFISLHTIGSLNTLGVFRSSGVLTKAAHIEILNRLVMVARNGDYDEYTYELINCLLNEDEVIEEHVNFLGDQLNDIDIQSFAGSDDLILALMSRGIRHGLLKSPNAVIRQICARVREWDGSSHEFITLAELVDLATGEDRHIVNEIAKETVRSYWINYVDHYIDDAQLLRDVYDTPHFADGFIELRDAVASELEGSGFKFSQAEVNSICETVDMDTIATNNLERTQDSYDPGPQPPKVDAVSENQLIDDLFDRDRPSR